MYDYSIVEKLIKAQGKTAFDVAKATGISTSTFTDWKKGRYVPKDDKRRKIAEYLGVTLDYLDTGIAEEKQSESGKAYYFDDDTAEVAQELFETPGLKMLFDAARDSKPEDLQMAADLLKRLKGSNPNG